VTDEVIPPCVLVVWEDAAVKDDGPWAANGEHVYKPHIVAQVGFLLAQTEQGIIITQAWHKETVAARDQIPAGMIRSITVLQPAKERRKRT
jgi:hypothetical protein